MDLLTPIKVQAVSAHPTDSPSAGYIYLYMFNNKLYQKDSSGVVTDLTATGGSNITTGSTPPSGGIDGDIYLQYT